MATIKEIAEIVGVSSAAVSRVLNYDEGISVSEETREAIFATAEKIGYKKKVIYVGINETIFLTKDESEYITGILEYQYNLPIVNTILTAGKNINDIYLILDNSIYCDTVKQEFTKIVDMAEKKFQKL